MNFHVLTLFPEMINDGLNHSVIGRAIEKGIINLDLINIRDFSLDKHKHVDDYPYGGGIGMIMACKPIYDAFKNIHEDVRKKSRVIYLSPQGKTLTQKIVKDLSTDEDLILLCGHYEGVDERIIEEIVTDEISIGDYVLTGGELPAMVLIDCLARHVPGVLGKDESAQEESFSDGKLEFPQYTRPEVFMDRKVPEVLLSGHHQMIEMWREEKSLERTAKRRPDLL